MGKMAKSGKVLAIRRGKVLGVVDNWKHKSVGMVCNTCMYFCNFRCRRNAPTNATMVGWPAVYKSDWCGNHKLDKVTMEGA